MPNISLQLTTQSAAALRRQLSFGVGRNKEEANMDFASQLVPALVILVANILGGSHTSSRWEYVTAIFGWTAGLSLSAFLVLEVAGPASVASDYVLQLFGFCLITALSRDYERILKPLFPWNR